MKATRDCSIEGCEGQHEARGFCAKHYQQFKRSPEFGAHPCSIDACLSPSWARGWCQAHYQRWQAYGDPLGSKPKRERRECSVSDCDRKADSRGLCSTHLARMRRTGTTDAYVPVIDRFDEFVRQLQPDECWEWLGHRNNKGYGKVGLLYAHRVACERAHGAPASPNMVAMHACDNPPCVNPGHLAWGEQAANIKDSWSRTRRKGAQ